MGEAAVFRESERRALAGEGIAMAGYPKGLREGIERKRARYDIACKRVLSIKSILARILGVLLMEYRGHDFDDIADRCIEGPPLIGVDPLSGGESEPFEELSRVRGSGVSRIHGSSGEAVDLTAGSVIFDVAFRALVPPPCPSLPGSVPSAEAVDSKGDGDGLAAPATLSGTSELVIDVEAQDDFHPGYPLTKRAMYYCARMLNDQRGTEFSGSRYERLKKVCSIWICTKPPRERQGTVSWLELGERVLPAGAKTFERAQYDLLTVVVVCLRDEDTGEREGVPGLINLLTVLLSRQLGVQEKLSILREYNIEVTDELESEVPRMLDTVEEILLEGWNKGVNEGREEGLERGQEKGRVSAFADSLRNLMQATGWPLETAMDSLGIPEDERAACVALIAR